MDFLTVDTLQSGTADSPPQQPNQPSTTRVDMGDCYQEIPINYQPQAQIKSKTKGNGRLKLALIVVSSLVLGVAIANAVNLKPYLVGSGDKTLQAQPTESPSPDTQATTDSHPPQETSVPEFVDVDPNLDLRNAYIDRAIEAAESQRRLVDETAADAILADARKANKVRGVDYQLYVLQRVTAAKNEVNNLIASGMDLTSTEGIRKTWILTSQLRALSIAWQRVNTQDSRLLADRVVVPNFSVIADIATITSEMDHASEYAIKVRSNTNQQIQRNQKILDDIRAKEQLKLLQKQKSEAQQVSDKGGDTNGK